MKFVTLMPLTVVSILAFSLPMTLKVDSLSAVSSMVGWHSGVSDRNEFWLTKQWSDALVSHQPVKFWLNK